MDLINGGDQAEKTWRKSFCVFRIVENGALLPVFLADSMKDAKYWITYIAEPGDALCRTPCHRKNETDMPLYWMHKGEKGDLCDDEHAWEELLNARSCERMFMEPTEDL